MPGEYRVLRSENSTYSSLFAPRYPPSPIDIAPAINSARLPNITILVSPRAERPAVKANGTVRPSERPMVASEITRASTLKPFGWGAVTSWPSKGMRCWASRSAWVMVLAESSELCRPELSRRRSTHRRDSASASAVLQKRFFRATRDMAWAGCLSPLISD